MEIKSEKGFRHFLNVEVKNKEKIYDKPKEEEIMVNKRITKRALSLILSAIMVLSLAACGGTGEEDKDDGKLSSKTNDEVVDMEGYEFTIASPFLLEDPVMSEITGAEAIFEEVRHKVEEDYNCTIKILAIDNYVENVRTKVLAGDKIADIIDVEGYHLIQLARSGCIVPLEEVDGLNLSDSRWLKGYTQMTEYNGQHYGTNFMRPAEARICLIYNRELLKESGITENPQELAKSKEWTFDKFREMCKAATKDTNGDGSNDTYGCYIGLPETFGTSMISANGGRLVTSVDGVAKETYSDAKVLNALNYVYDLVNTDKSVKVGPSITTGDSQKEATADFVAGEYAFYFCETWVINQILKPTAGDMDYGIVTIPMGPDATEYVSPFENARNFCITSTNKEVDKTVIILNALARYIEEYDEDPDWWHYDVEMDYFQEGDTASVEAYIGLIDTASYDLGVGVTELWSDFKSRVIWDACYQNKGTPASAIQAISGKYQSAVDAVYN